MGLSTHVLDTMHGSPAAGMEVALYTTDGTARTRAPRWSGASRSTPTAAADGPLYDNGALKTGTYRLVFDVAGYFKARGVKLPEPNFLNRVALDFGVAHTEPALPRAAAGQPVELFDLSRVVRLQSCPSVSVSSWKWPLLSHSQVSVQVTLPMRAGDGEGRGAEHGALDLGDHFGRMRGRAHPVHASTWPLASRLTCSVPTA